MADRLEKLDPGLFEVGQVGRVVDDPHGVGLGEAGAQAVREGVVRPVARRLQGLAHHSRTSGYWSRTTRPLRRVEGTPTRRRHPVDSVPLEHRELSLGLDGDDATLHDPALGVDPPLGHPR